MAVTPKDPTIMQLMEESFRLGKGLDPHHPDHVIIHFKDAFNRIDGRELPIVCHKDETRENLIERYYNIQREVLHAKGVCESNHVKMVYHGGDGSIAYRSLRDLHCEDGAVWMVVFRILQPSTDI